jgi:hypothetical protein
MECLSLMDKKLIASLQETHTVCELCKKGVGTENFKRHEEEQHTAKNSPAIIARKLKHNERRKMSQKERYANDTAYGNNARMRNDQTGVFRVQTKPLTTEDLAFFFRPRSSAPRKLKRNEHCNMSRKEQYANDAADGNNAEERDSKTGVFQVQTKLLTAKDLAFFFRPRSASGLL